MHMLQKHLEYKRCFLSRMYLPFCYPLFSPCVRGYILGANSLGITIGNSEVETEVRRESEISSKMRACANNRQSV